MATDQVMAGAVETPVSTLYCSNIDWKIKKQVLRRSLHALFSRHGKVRRFAPFGFVVCMLDSLVRCMVSVTYKTIMYLHYHRRLSLTLLFTTSHTS